MARHVFDPAAPVLVLETVLEGPTKVRKRLTMVLDTGATYMMIPWEVAEALGYQPEVVRQRILLTTASGIERAPLISVDSVEVLGKQVRHVDTIVHDLPPTSRVDGLLGLSFLRNFRVTLDFKQGVLDLEE